MNADAKRVVIERYLDAYNNFDIERMMELLHADIEFTDISGGEVTNRVTGASAFRDLAEQSKHLFASRTQTMTRFEEAGNQATITVDYTGVLAADLPNGMQAGDVLNLTGRSEFVFQEGKLIRITDYS